MSEALAQLDPSAQAGNITALTGVEALRQGLVGEGISLAPVELDAAHAQQVLDSFDHGIGPAEAQGKIRSSGLSVNILMNESRSNLGTISEIANGRVTEPVVVTPRFSEQTRRSVEHFGIGAEAAVLKSSNGVLGILRTLGMGDKEAAMVRPTGVEVYTAAENGQPMVAERIFEIPGRGRIREQRLEPQGGLVDSQVVFEPAGTR